MSSSEEAKSRLGKWKRDKTFLKLMSFAPPDVSTPAAPGLSVAILQVNETQVLVSTGKDSLWVSFGDAQTFTVSADAVEIERADRTRVLFVEER